MSDPACPKLPFQLRNGRFVATNKLGNGNFASVCYGEDTQKQKKRIAIKLEDAKHKSPQLKSEYEILKRICGEVKPEGFVEVYDFGAEKNFTYLCMELLWKTLEDVLQSYGPSLKDNKVFPVRTALVIAEQVLRRMEYLHSRCIVHRDIKPENFAFGQDERRHHIYLIDFGLSKVYYDKAKHRHQPETHRPYHLTGTARYASINAHLGIEQSRRDDLEACGHMFMYFIRGALPWSGLTAKSPHDKYRKIMDKKRDTKLTDLCRDFPPCFRTYLERTRALKYKQRPNYSSLRQLFLDARKEYGDPDESALRWFESSAKSTLRVLPIEEWNPPEQPDDNIPEEFRRNDSTEVGSGPLSCFSSICARICGG